jgi:aldehyde:ferredoxin oxidoreductase
MSLFPDARILEIDLTNEKIQMKSLPGDTYRLYPGGSALGLYLLLREVNPEVDPLSPENMLVFSVSPLTGLPISGQSRMVVTTKSPLTGGIGDSQSGGFFPAALKSNGWDAIAIKGKARQPVYLYIEGEKVQLRPAAHFWGKVTGETEKAIKVELGEQALEIAQIGPAGENLVKYACIAWGLSWQLFGPTELVELCRAGIGWDTSLFELMRVGERRINMMRHFNAKAGFTREDDRLPARIFSPLPDGPAKGISVNKVKFAQALDIYYSYAGWDAKTGNPTEATLRKLSLGWLL